jgi:gentisate 1,2-dioxygenase
MSKDSTDEKSLLGFSREIGKLSLTPLWERVGGMKPGTPCVPKIWHYAELRPKLVEATTLITEREAERRVLVLENPSLRGTTYIANTLYAGLQIIMPGELAPAHRHTPNALRFVIEGEGAYTTIAGERAVMHPGDFIVTPNWAWHDHGNNGSGPVVWLDGLDTPFAKFVGGQFREEHSEESQPILHKEGDALARFGSNLLPINYEPEGRASPILLYPYERVREAICQLSRSGPPDPAHGIKLRYANPANGEHPFPTIAAFMQLLPRGFEGEPYRSTESAVFIVVEGTGSVLVGEERYTFTPNDIFVIPSWSPYRFDADSEVILFSYSDKAVQEALGFWKEQTKAGGER